MPDLSCYAIGCWLVLHELCTEDDGEPFYQVRYTQSLLPRVGARTPEALQEDLGQALLTITAQEALGWSTHCGYLASDGQENLTAQPPIRR
jgi:hypothetical protein